MNRRGRRAGRVGVPAWYKDPGLALGAVAAWDAADAPNAAGVTTSLAPYIGAVSLLPHGTGQAAAAASALVGGRMAISCDGNGAANGYGAVLFGGAPSAISILSVGYVAATNTGLSASTVGGAVNTGVSQLMIGTAYRGRKVTTDALATLDPLPKPVLTLTVVDAAGITHYMNSLTPASAVQAGAIAGTTFHIGCLAAAGTFTHNGLWSRSIVWDRALTSSESRWSLLMLSRYYQMALAGA